MTIPTLTTADKLFICSYNIGSNVDHRKSLGNINEITTFTNEYIDGYCWIPVNCAGVDNNESWYYDEPDKNVVYVKVGVRVAVDGYLHAWLLSTQKVSELILWNNKYNDTNQPIDDITVLHWCIEKLYRGIFGNTTSFVIANIKFQNYISGSTRLYLFGNYSNSFLNPTSYTIDHPTNVKKSSVSWYPNNSTTILGDYIFSSLDLPAHKCAIDELGTTLNDTPATAAFLDDGGSFTDYSDKFNDPITNDVKLVPALEAPGDSFYFGYDYRFYGLKLNIGTAGVGSGNLIDWEFWDGSAWEQFFPTDPTNEFTTSGTNTVIFNMTDDNLLDWTKTTVNGSSLYWIRAKVVTANYTTQPLLTQGWIRACDEWFDFGVNPIENDPNDAEPLFWLRVDDVAKSTSIASLCNPTDPALTTVTECHVIATSSVATGNNSGRTYNLVDPGSGTNCDTYSSCTNLVSEKYLSLNQENNRAYVWVDPPGEYQCDPSFTYDTIVNYTVSEWQSITPTSIEYVQAKAQFLDRLIGDKILATYYEVDSGDTFIEATGDLDELKHFNFTITDIGSVTNTFKTIFTKHVGVGLLTDAVPTLNSNDWVISWSTNDYFSNWQIPDGLAARTPTVTNTPYTRPLTHNDEFNVVSNEPVLGGFLYESATSNAFLSRNPGTETKIDYPTSDKSDFSYLNKLITSNGFLSRNPGTEVKIDYPTCDQSDFSYIYSLISGDAFLGRDPGTETKIDYPVGDADFCFLYKLIRNVFFDRYHLKTNGDDTKDGLTWDNAWKHWTYSMANVPPNGIILVEDGLYNDGETQLGRSESIIIDPRKNGLDAPSVITVTI